MPSANAISNYGILAGLSGLAGSMCMYKSNLESCVDFTTTIAYSCINDIMENSSYTFGNRKIFFEEMYRCVTNSTPSELQLMLTDAYDIFRNQNNQINETFIKAIESGKNNLLSTDCFSKVLALRSVSVPLGVFCGSILTISLLAKIYIHRRPIISLVQSTIKRLNIFSTNPKPPEPTVYKTKRIKPTEKTEETQNDKEKNEKSNNPSSSSINSPSPGYDYEKEWKQVYDRVVNDDSSSYKGKKHKRKS